MTRPFLHNSPLLSVRSRFSSCSLSSSAFYESRLKPADYSLHVDVQTFLDPWRTRGERERLQKSILLARLIALCTRLRTNRIQANGQNRFVPKGGAELQAKGRHCTANRRHYTTEGGCASVPSSRICDRTTVPFLSCPSTTANRC